MKRSFASRLLEMMLYILGVGAAGVVTAMPWLTGWYLRMFRDRYEHWAGYQLFLLFFLIAVGLGALWIIGELIFMVRSIASGPFVWRNVTAFVRMGAVALGVALLFFVKCVPFFTPLTLACGMILLLCSLLAFVLADLFRAAVAFREENDLTI